jgi:hypothetical protein
MERKEMEKYPKMKRWGVGQREGPHDMVCIVVAVASLADACCLVKVSSLDAPLSQK